MILEDPCIKKIRFDYFTIKNEELCFYGLYIEIYMEFILSLLCIEFY